MLPRGALGVRHLLRRVDDTASVPGNRPVSAPGALPARSGTESRARVGADGMRRGETW